LSSPAEALRVVGLRTEYLEAPHGIDAPHPRLTWFETSARRGNGQTAFQILVAGTASELARNQGSLWDSGKVNSPAQRTEYGGKTLRSGTDCFWKVRAWGSDGRVGPWSEAGFFSTGLRSRSEWKAEWITSPVLADPTNRPRTPIHCYRSELTSNPDATSWIALDLGSARNVDRIVLAPARPNGLTFDIGTVQFPKRFVLEVADRPDFRDSKVLADQRNSDYPEPRGNACEFKFPATRGRYIRLLVTRLGGWDAHDFGVFLAQFSAYSGTENVAVGARVTASSSVENERWSKSFLVDGHPNIEFSAFPPALDPKVDGVFSPSRTTLLRREFDLTAPIKRATLYATARGFYEARLNGRRVSQDLLAPGFTDFHRRISYETYDVTGLLRTGPNAIGALLGYGWYAGHMNLGGNAYFYGYFPQFAAQLEIEYADGHRQTIGTDKQWSTSLDGPIRWSDLLDGEACDFRKEQAGWDQPGFPRGVWQRAWSQPLGPEQLVAQKTPPVRVMREMKPVSRREIRPGAWVYDLGQEITGWVRLSASGPSGTHIVLRHTEAVQANGEIDTASLWGTPQRDDYILDGKGSRTLEPHFTYHGFRYFEITGLRSAPERVTAIDIHSDVAEVGKFECSNPLFNQLMSASQWTQRNLFFDVPAGCAARSERLAWTGDIRPCVQTALFNFDTAAFFEKYAADLRDDQKADGRFTDICPHAHLTGTDICVGSPGWADAGVSLPWDVYVNTGDPRVLEEHFEAAKRWVDFVHAQNPDLIWSKARGMDWGDWLSAGRATPREIGSTAFFAHSTDLVARMARVLGHTEDANTYGDLFVRIRAAFTARFVSRDGRIRVAPVRQIADVTAVVARFVMDGSLNLVVGNDSLGLDPAPGVEKRLHLKFSVGSTETTREYREGAKVNLEGNLKILEATYGSEGHVEEDAQGSYALALLFGLLDEPLKSKAVQRLLNVITRDHGHPSTGFWSSLELMLALSENGHQAEASEMANLTSAPSWGYMVTHGTTFWEAFDADKKTLSLNHWTHSACGEWLWRDVAGLSPDPDKPGYERFIVRPLPTKDVNWSKASYRSVRGDIKLDWRLSDKKFVLSLQVPPGSTAQVYFPPDSKEITESGHKIARADGVRLLKTDGRSPVYEVRSGSYRFAAKS